ncbi:TonB-dependent receptor [Paludibacter sp.]
MKKIIFILALLSILPSLYAQVKYTISGYITDSKNGETLSGATIVLKDLPSFGVISDIYGYFSFIIPEGEHTLKINYIGYQEIEFPVNLSANIRQDFKVEQSSTLLSEIVVSPNKKNDNITKTSIGVEKLTISEIKNIPVLFGEPDVLKTVSLTPGVTSLREGNGGSYVRGGNSSQNLILLDEAVVYYPFHLLGFFSTFNNDAIKDITVYKGTAPAYYGGRISSVMDVRMKDGNNQSFGVSGGVGLISSRLTLECPIVKDRGSFIVSGRRTYIDMLMKLTNNPDISNNTLNFYDLNAKVNFKINKNNRIYLSAYSGRDAFEVPNHFGMSWGNRTATCRLKHFWHDKLYSNTLVAYSDFDYDVKLAFEPSAFNLVSGIKSVYFKHEFSFIVNNRSNLNVGFDNMWHDIKPGQLVADANAIVHPKKIEERHGQERAIYVHNEYRPSDNWILNLGVRVSRFRLHGPGTFYRYENGLLKDSLIYTSTSRIKTFVTPEKRFNVTHIINQQQSIKFDYSSNTQNIHLISTSDASLPVDIWLMTDYNIRPQASDQISLGYNRNSKDDMYQFSAEAYFKWIINQIDLKKDADIMANEHIEGELIYGKGRSYGLELMLKKAYGKLYGWVAYTLSKTELNMPGINNGNWYPARHDVTNDLSIVGVYQLTKKLTFSATWVYQTGNAVTFPIGTYTINGETKYLYGDRNSNRMPDYHRLDLGLTWNFKSKSKFESSLNLSVYNAYARKNAFAIDFLTLSLISPPIITF